MILKVFAIFDTKAEVYKNPWYMASTAEALRAFTSLANDKQSVVHQYPKEFQLVQVAEWDDATGKFQEMFKELGFADGFIDPGADKLFGENPLPLRVSKS